MASRVEAEPIAATRRPPTRRRRRVPWGSIVKHGILLFCCVIILFPLFWVFLLSIKSLPDAYTNHIWPNDFEFGSYRNAAHRGRHAAAERSEQHRPHARHDADHDHGRRARRLRARAPADAGQAARARDPRRVALRAEPRHGPDLDLGDPGPARADQLDLGADPPVPDARARGQHLHHARRLRDDPEGAAGVGARRRRELVHDPAPDHAPARPQRRDRRPDHELHRGVGRVAAREHAHERPGEAAADGRDRRRRTRASASGSGRRWRRCTSSRSCPA